MAFLFGEMKINNIPLSKIFGILICSVLCTFLELLMHLQFIVPESRGLYRVFYCCIITKLSLRNGTQWLCKSERTVLALKVGPFRRVKYSIFGSLYQGQYSPITWGWFAPTGREMSLNVGWNRLLRYGDGCLGFNHRAQMVQVKAESDCGMHG